MAREATNKLLQVAAKRFGTEPINIIRIEWDDVTTYYGDKSLEIDTISVVGAILDFSTLSSQVKSDGAGDFSSVSVKLDDSENNLKQRVNTQVLEGRTATVYQYFENLDVSDLMVLLKGRISGDIVWSEGERTLSFDIEHYIEDNEVGYSATEEEIPNISEDAVDKVWPLCFGTVLKVPALHLLKPPSGALRNAWNSDLNGVRSPILIERGEEFPQDVTIDIMVGSIRVRGTMSRDEFTVEEANLPVYTNVVLLDRPVDDLHTQDARVVWIQDDSTRLVGQYCTVEYFREGAERHFLVNYCIAQYGNKCYFRKPWQIIITTGSGETSYQGLNVLLSSEQGVFLETAGITRKEWEDTYWTPTGGLWEPGGPNNESLPTLEPFPAWQRFGNIRGYWRCEPGTFVRQITGYNDLYIANLLPSTEILEVYAWRSYRKEDIFVPIPSRYYTVHTNYNIAGRYVTAIEFEQPLIAFNGENWNENIFVSLRSSQGPNPANVINWLIQTYSNLEVDYDSFESVRKDLIKFWANFVVFDQPNVLSLCEDIARQSRCALLIGNGEVKLKYLSKIPVTIQTINEDLTELKSLMLSFSTLDDIITKTVNEWLLDYSKREEYEKEYVYKNNIDAFGLVEEEEKYKIYNVELFVKISAGFWGYRSSNVWRKLALTTFIQAIEAEAFDAFTISIGEVSANDLIAEIDTQNHNTNYAPNIEVELTAGSKSGESDEDGQPIIDENYWLGDPNYPVDMEIPNNLDPGAGREQIDYIVPTDIEGDGGDGEDPETPDPYILVFKYVATIYTRGQAGLVTIEIQDKNGEVVQEDKTGQLILKSTDNLDVLGDGAPGVSTTISIEFQAGVYTSESIFISDGSDLDSGTFVVSVEGLTATESVNFEIKDPDIGALSWDICPGGAVTRQQDFSVKLTGGAPNQDINIEVSVDDPRDKIYVNDQLAGTKFILVLDGSGEYESTKWQIRGGYLEPASILINAKDPNKLLTQANCIIETVIGASAAVVLQTFLVGQQVYGDSVYMELSVVGFAGIDEPFELAVALFNADGTLNDFTGPVTISAVDANGDVVDWVDAGPEANNVGNFITVSVVDGEWFYNEVILDILTSNISPVTITGVANVNGEPVTASVDVIIGSAYLQVTIITEISRGVLFDIGVQAMNGDGTPNTTYVPSVALDVSLVSDDVSDFIFPLTIDTFGWVNGYKLTSNFDVNGGTGADAAEITVVDSVQGIEGGQIVYLDSTPVAKSPSVSEEYYGQDSRMATFIGPDYYLDWDPMDCESQADSWFTETLQGAINDFRIDNTLGASSSFRRYVRDLYHYASHFASVEFGYTKFSITAGDRAGAKGFSLRVKTVHVQYYDPIARETRLSPLAGYYRLRLGVTESLDYLNGSDVESMINPIEYSYSYINQKEAEAGWTAPAVNQNPVPVEIDIPLPVEWLDDMVGNELYLWWYVSGPLTPYNCSLYSVQDAPPAGTSSERGGEEQYTDLSGVQVRIQK